MNRNAWFLFVAMMVAVGFLRRGMTDNSKSARLAGKYIGSRETFGMVDTTFKRVIYEVEITPESDDQINLQISEETQCRKNVTEPFVTINGSIRIFKGATLNGLNKFAVFETKQMKLPAENAAEKIRVEGKLTGDILRLNINYDLSKKSRYDYFSLLLRRVG